MNSKASNTMQSRLDRTLRNFGSVADLAQLIGVSDNAIYKWMSGRGQPSVANLVALANASKVSLEWLATGRETGSSVRGHSDELRHEEFVFVAHHSARGIGPGAEMLRSDQIVDNLAFKKEWVASRLNVDSRNLLLIEAVGDSMAPTIEESDLILVDLGEPRFRHDGIYVLRRDDELVVKRLQRRPDGTLSIISDNPAYQGSVVTRESVQIIGRAIWVGGAV